jgi:hypothetical protein
VIGVVGLLESFISIRRIIPLCHDRLLAASHPGFQWFSSPKHVT